jgi:crossover junction endodeoxyribonuclease RuvC
MAIPITDRAGEAIGPQVANGRVVGIDPGLNVTGYAVIEGMGQTVQIIEAGIIRTYRAKQDLATRLRTIHAGIFELLDEFAVEAVALEQVHTHLKRPSTAVLMAHARGVILLAAGQKGIPVVGYAAARIKKTLTGNGRAPKDQMQRAIQTELGLDRLPEPHDVADACGIAICHLYLRRTQAALDSLSL